MPILARKDGTVIAGHGRLEAAKTEGMAHVPVIVATGWSEAQCRAYTLADNKLGETSEWDEEALGLELDDLRGFGVDLSEFGFEEVSADDASNDVGVSLEPIYQVLIECESEGDQLKTLERLQGLGITCRALIA